MCGPWPHGWLNNNLVDDIMYIIVLRPSRRTFLLRTNGQIQLLSNILYIFKLEYAFHEHWKPRRPQNLWHMNTHPHTSHRCFNWTIIWPQWSCHVTYWPSSLTISVLVSCFSQNEGHKRGLQSVRKSVIDSIKTRQARPVYTNESCFHSLTWWRL